MKTSKLFPSHSSLAAPLAVLAALLTCLATPAAHAAALTWDITSGDGATITAGSGNWNTTAGNLVWNNAGANPNVTWSQTSTTVPLNSATFAGSDGTVDSYVVTLASQMACSGLTFNNTGYKITGSTVYLVSNPITVAANKTASINSAIGYVNNTAVTITVNSGGTLNLGGGAGNSQYAFSGGGTVNMTAGTYTANIGKVNVPTFNQSGGTFNITPGNVAGFNIGNNAGQSVNYTLTNGTLAVNGNANTPGVSTSFLGLGNNASSTAYANTLTVQNGATVNIGTTASRAGELRIAGNNVANGKLDVQGGTVTIGTGDPGNNQIYFFKSGADAGYTATMTQSGGTVTANGIQFGFTSGTYDPASSATLQLSGGSLYIGAQGITLGFAASALPVTIQLQGGTLGANQNWSSTLDMKLGTTGGGPTIRAQNSASTARNITLSGILSDDTAVNGTLTKTGTGTLTLSGASANTFSGATLVSAGTLDLGKASAVSSSSSVTIASGATLALSTSSSTVPNLTVAGSGALSFDVASGYSLTVSGTDGVTNSGAAGSVTINITGSAPANGTYTLIAYSGALQGSGFSAYVLGTTPAGKTYALNDTGSAVELFVSNPYNWTGLQSTEWSTATIAGSKNWTQGGSPADYTDGQGVVFDETATGYTVDISVADVTPASVFFNNNGGTPYTLQGSKAIAGTTPLTKMGSQPLTILNTNTYTGGTTISAGTLQADASGALGVGLVTLSGGSLSNNVTATLTNAVNLSSLVNVGVGASQTLTLSGNITNNGGVVTKYGMGTLALSGNNTFNTGVSVRGGTVSVNSIKNGGVSCPLGAAPSSTTIQLGAAGVSGVLEYTGSGDTTDRKFTIGATASAADANGGTINNNGSGALAFTNTTINVTIASVSATRPLTLGGSYAGGANTIKGVIQDNATGTGGLISLTKAADASIWALTGTSTYSGGTTISGGTLQLGDGTSGNDGTIASTAGVTNNATLIFKPNGSTTAGYVISGTGNVIKDGAGTLTLTNANTFSGGVTIKNGTLESKTTTTTLGTGTVVMGGAGSTGATYHTGQGNTNAFTIDAPDSGTSVIGANGTGSGFTLSGPITLNGANLNVRTFNGGTTASAILSGGVTGTGNLLLNNQSTTTGKVTLSGANPINNTGTITCQGVGTNANVISAVIGTNVTGVIQNSATCPLILSATNTYTGPTTVSAGTLVIKVASLAASSTVSVASNAVLQLDFTTTNVVAGFITNGVSLPAGVYNAANGSPFIAGSGSLQVVSTTPPQPTIAPVSVSGTNLVVSVPTTLGFNYVLQSATNLTPTINWQNESTNAGTGGNLILNVPIEPAKPQKFLRFWVY